MECFNTNSSQNLAVLLKRLSAAAVNGSAVVEECLRSGRPEECHAKLGPTLSLINELDPQLRSALVEVLTHQPLRDPVLKQECLLYQARLEAFLSLIGRAEQALRDQRQQITPLVDQSLQLQRATRAYRDQCSPRHEIAISKSET